MKVQIQKWGNSLALRIPKSFALETKIEQGSTVEVALEKGQITVKPVKDEITLESLLAEITEENLHAEIDFGKPKAKRFGNGLCPRTRRSRLAQFQPAKWTRTSRTTTAIVVSPSSYNRKVGLALFCPLRIK